MGPTTKDVTPLSRAEESLKSLGIIGHPGPIIDGPLVSPVQMFRNLVSPNKETFCHTNGDNRCTLKLNDDDVAELAIVAFSVAPSDTHTKSRAWGRTKAGRGVWFLQLDLVSR